MLRGNHMNEREETLCQNIIGLLQDDNISDTMKDKLIQLVSDICANKSNIEKRYASTLDIIQHIENIDFSLTVITHILEGTINNELGKSSDIIKFDSILSFAKYLNTLNSQLQEQVRLLKLKL